LTTGGLIIILIWQSYYIIANHTVQHGTNKLEYNIYVDCTMMTPI